MNMNNTNWILFDISSLLYRTFFVNKNVDDDTSAGLAMHAAVITLNKYFKQMKPRKVITIFDRNSWRKEYTANAELCYSGKPYKGNRRQNMTPSEKARYQRFLGHIRDFENMVENYTTIVTLAGDGLEADDLIAGFVQMFPEENHTIVSSDKDFIQLLRNPNVSLLDPDSGKQRTLEEWNNDAEYFIFQKMLKGDVGDNVQSAYPRIREKKILEAYNDPFVKVNILNDRWTDAHGKEFIVKKLFEENKLLMDLTCQPEHIRQKIDQTITESLNKERTYSHFHFLKFCGKYDLKKIAEQAETFVPLFSK